jgi:hypothetical protein
MSRPGRTLAAPTRHIFEDLYLDHGTMPTLRCEHHRGFPKMRWLRSSYSLRQSSTFMRNLLSIIAIKLEIVSMLRLRTLSCETVPSCARPTNEVEIMTRQIFLGSAQLTVRYRLAGMLCDIIGPFFGPETIEAVLW